MVTGNRGAVMTVLRCLATCCVLAACGLSVVAAPPAGLKQRIEAWVAANQRAIVTAENENLRLGHFFRAITTMRRC